MQGLSRPQTALSEYGWKEEKVVVNTRVRSLDCKDESVRVVP